MEELKPKKTVARRRRVMKAANAPEPTGPVGGSTPDEPTDPQCGHMGCTGGSCNVHYVGPTSHMRDHHIVHAARGISHVWSAAIITGLAIVITGAIALSSVQAATSPSASSGSSDLRAISQRLDRIESAMRGLSEKCSPTPKPGGANVGTLNNVPTSSGVVPLTCRNKCMNEYTACTLDSSSTPAACTTAKEACLAACN